MRLGRLAVSGRSMLPTLHPGDWLLVGWGVPVRSGALVVVRLPQRPVSVKRAVVRDDVGWWVDGHTPAAGTDSWSLGMPVPDADVLGVVLWRYPPLVRRSVT